VTLSAKKACEYESGCSYLATYNCHVCSTFHCDKHVNLHFYETHEMDLHKHELFWTKFASFGNTLGVLCTVLSEEQCDEFAFMACIVCEVAFCSKHSGGHDCIGTYHSHQFPTKFKEFMCQHCKIVFKEYRESDRYADFTGERDLIEGKKEIKEPTCLPCEDRLEKEFSKALEYVPVILPSLYDDSDDDKVSVADNQNHTDQNKDDLGKDDDICNDKEGYDNHSKDNKESFDACISEELAVDDNHNQNINPDLSATSSPIRRALSHCIHGCDG